VAAAASREQLDALTERIMAAARQAPPGRSASPIRAEVDTLRQRAASVGQGATAPRRAVSWPALSFMAASLLVGVLTGASGALDRVLEPLRGVTQMAQDAGDASEADETEIAFGGDDPELIEEDMW
jgi:hypothetical protein